MTCERHQRIKNDLANYKKQTDKEKKKERFYQDCGLDELLIIGLFGRGR
ncbi:unnamed protein product, partial [Callosobruchus maculatus]